MRRVVLLCFGIAVSGSQLLCISAPDETALLRPRLAFSTDANDVVLMVTLMGAEAGTHTTFVISGDGRVTGSRFQSRFKVPLRVWHAALDAQAFSDFKDAALHSRFHWFDPDVKKYGYPEPPAEPIPVATPAVLVTLLYEETRRDVVDTAEFEIEIHGGKERAAFYSRVPEYKTALLLFQLLEAAKEPPP